MEILLDLAHKIALDTAEMQVKENIEVPAKIPASCGFAGQNMDFLVVVTASWSADIENDINAGFTFMKKMNVSGRKPYLFGERKIKNEIVFIDRSV